MTKEEMRIAIAEKCGWRDAFPINGEPHSETRRGGIMLPYHWVNEITHERRFDLPDYPADLNAMHDAEESLTDTQAYVYIQYLLDLVKAQNADVSLTAFRLKRATAAQSAEALCRTLWPERFSK